MPKTCIPGTYLIKFTQNIGNSKVLYLPTNNKTIRQSGTEKAFVDNGFQLWSYDYRNSFTDNGEKYSIKKLLEIVAEYKPDWIHMQLQYCGLIDPLLLEQIKIENPNMVITNWSGDVREEIQHYFIECGNKIDLSLLCNKGQIPIYKQHGLKNLEYWQNGLDPEKVYRMSDNNRENLRNYYNHDIVFCGGRTLKFPDSQLRMNIADAFWKKFNNKFGVYGAGWEGYPYYRGTIPYDDQNNVYNGSRIALSVNHFNNIEMYFSDRQLITMGSGTFTLCHYIPGLEEYFENGKDCVWFKSIHEAIEKAEYYLNNLEEAEIIGKNGAKKVLEGHTYFSRIKELSERLNLNQEGNKICK